MKFDVLTLGDHLPDPVSRRYNDTQAERFRLWVDFAIHAENLGYDAVWMGEHHCSDYIMSSPQMVLAAIAARTDRIRLGTAVSLLPNNDPVRVAEDFATLDLLSGGRAEVGFGSGITEHTFRLFGQDVETGAERGRENLDLLLALWNKERIDWEGKFRSPIHDSRLEPRTWSGRQLPINRATSSSLATAREAGASGFRLMVLANLTGFAAARPLAETYREAYTKAGHDPAGMIVTSPVFAHVQADGDEARAFWLPYMANYGAFIRALTEHKGATRSILEVMAKVQNEHVPIGAKDMIGSPAELTEKILQADADIGGLDKLMLHGDIGGMPRQALFASMQMFADEVLPAVKRELGRPVCEASAVVAG